MPVIYEKLDYLRSVIIGAWVQVGSRYEKAKEYGFSHLVEHMLFKGTERRGAREIAGALERLGGEMNAFTSREYSCYYTRAASHHFSTAMDVLADIVLNSTFPDKELEREQQVVLEEIRMYEDSPEELSHEVLQSSMFSSTLGHPIVGSAKVISTATRESVMGYWERMYKPGRMFLTVLGNVSQDELEARLSHFSSLIKGRAARPLSLGTTHCSTARTLIRKPIEQLHLCFGVKGLSMTDEDRYTLHLINTYIGGGMSSRLFQEIRERRGLAYNVYSFIQSFHDSGLWGFYCATNPQNGPKVRAILESELSRLVKKGIGASTVRQLKDQMIGGLLLGLERTSFRMTRVAVGRLYFDEVVPVDKVIDLIESVSVDDVKRVAAALLGDGFTASVAVGPVPEGQEKDILGGEPTATGRRG